MTPGLVTTGGTRDTADWTRVFVTRGLTREFVDTAGNFVKIGCARGTSGIGATAGVWTLCNIAC